MKIKFNKGEWSEIYVLLYILMEWKIKIGYTNNTANNEYIHISKVIVDDQAISQLSFEAGDYKSINCETQLYHLSNYKDLLKNILTKQSNDHGTIYIKDIEKLLEELIQGRAIKSKSFSKEDIKLILQNDNSIKSFSIKSFIGNPPTLLNSSKHTNFLFKVENISTNDISLINAINSKDKIKDRIKKIKELGGNIKFVRCCSENYETNLRTFAPHFDRYISKLLLSSYSTRNKSLVSLIEDLNSFQISNNNSELKKFLLATAFGMIPSKTWNQSYNCNGGFIIVDKSGELTAILLEKDNLSKIENFLLNNTKLDTPSSSRYKICELYKEGNDIYFTLNLQIRFKKIS